MDENAFRGLLLPASSKSSQQTSLQKRNLRRGQTCEDVSKQESKEAKGQRKQS